MAGAERMTIEEVVRRVLREEHCDVIGESVRDGVRKALLGNECLPNRWSCPAGASRNSRR
jgi:hypothetical protein